MPNVAPIMKIQKCESYGAEVVIHGHDMKEAKHHAMLLAKEKGLTYINGLVKFVFNFNNFHLTHSFTHLMKCSMKTNRKLSISMLMGFFNNNFYRNRKKCW